MLAVEKGHRGQGIAKKLVCQAIEAMKKGDADEVSNEKGAAVITRLTIISDCSRDRD